MSVDISSWVWKHSPTTGSKRLILLSLADNCNDQGVCWPSIGTIAKRCKMSRRYAQRLIHELEVEGHIKIHYRRDEEKDLNKSNMYQVVVNNRPLPDEQEDTTPSEQETTRVVNSSSPKPSFNRNIKPSIEGEEPTPDWNALDFKDIIKIPEIALYRKITGRIPGRPQYPFIYEAIRKVGCFEELLLPFWKEHVVRGGKSEALYWLTEWAVNKSIPTFTKNGQTTKPNTAYERSMAALENVAKELGYE